MDAYKNKQDVAANYTVNATDDGFSIDFGNISAQRSLYGKGMKQLLAMKLLTANKLKRPGDNQRWKQRELPFK